MAWTSTAPQNLQETSGDGRVLLAWNAPASSGDSPIISYKIFRGNSSGQETLLATVGNVTTYVDENVTNGQTYYYMVAAVNGAGEGQPSDEASATPSAQEASTMPSAQVIALVVWAVVAAVAGIACFVACRRIARHLRAKHRLAGVTVLLSYRREEKQTFHVREIAVQLRHQKGINRVIFAKGGEIGEKVLRTCDAILLFCTPAESKPPEARSTWDAALRSRLPVIPVFTRQEDIPILLRPMQGIEFKAMDMPGTMKAIYEVISTIGDRRYGSSENAPSERERID